MLTWFEIKKYIKRCILKVFFLSPAALPTHPLDN